MSRLLYVVLLLLSMGGSAAEVSLQERGEGVQSEWLRSGRPEFGRPGPAPVFSQDKAGGGVVDGVAQLWLVSLQDKTLYRVMRRWTAQAKYQLVWQVDRDFPIESEVVFEGGFRDAVAAVMASVALTDFPLQANFNAEANVLRITRFLDAK